MLLLLVRRQCHISDINQMIIKRAKELCLVVNPDPGSQDKFLITAQQFGRVASLSFVFFGRIASPCF